MEWKHFTERVNGVNIHFVAQGEGEPVILLHGWPEFWYSWRNQLPVLETRTETPILPKSSLS